MYNQYHYRPFVSGGVKFSNLLDHLDEERYIFLFSGEEIFVKQGALFTPPLVTTLCKITADVSIMATVVMNNV